jgi:hypothetical protein
MFAVKPISDRAIREAVAESGPGLLSPAGKVAGKPGREHRSRKVPKEFWHRCTLERLYAGEQRAAAEALAPDHHFVT